VPSRRRRERLAAVEILALRHQLGVLERSVKRPRLTNADRGLWVLLSRTWARWNDALIIVKPATVIAWHRAGFRRYWAWRSRHKGGRPGIDPEVRALIKRMATANLISRTPSWPVAPFFTYTAWLTAR